MDGDEYRDEESAVGSDAHRSRDIRAVETRACWHGRGERDATYIVLPTGDEVEGSDGGGRGDGRRGR